MVAGERDPREILVRRLCELAAVESGACEVVVVVVVVVERRAW